MIRFFDQPKSKDLFLIVSLANVSLTIGLCGEGVATLFTIEGSLARVRSHVPYHEALFEGAVVANFALISLDFYVFRFLVIVQVVLGKETVGTEFAVGASWIGSFLIFLLGVGGSRSSSSPWLLLDHLRGRTVGVVALGRPAGFERELFFDFFFHFDFGLAATVDGFNQVSVLWRHELGGGVAQRAHCWASREAAFDWTTGLDL